MSPIKEWFTDRPKTEGEEPAYSGHGQQAGPHATGQLGESPAHLAALARLDDARDAVAGTPEIHPHIPLIREEPERPDDWHPETFIIKPGEVVQILGRDDQRDAADVTNQTSLENFAAAGTPVYLFRDHNTAERFVNNTIQQTSGAFIILPDGSGRVIWHTAGVWAAVRATAPSSAVLDVTAERFKSRRAAAEQGRPRRAGRST